MKFESLYLIDKLTEIKNHRDDLLAACAWTQLADAPLTAAEKANWQAYREALQVIEFGVPTPDDIDFPEPPIFTNAPPSAEVLAMRADRQTLKDQYQAAIDRLQQIENAVNPTNAQVIQAVKDIAHYERILAKVLVKLIA